MRVEMLIDHAENDSCFFAHLARQTGGSCCINSLVVNDQRGFREQHAGQGFTLMAPVGVADWLHW